MILHFPTFYFHTSYILIVIIYHLCTLFWGFCPGLKYFVLIDMLTQPALREGPHYKWESVLQLLQTQSPSHRSLSHQYTRMKQRRKDCRPGSHTCSPEKTFPRWPLVLLKRLASCLWTTVLPWGFLASCPPLVWTEMYPRKFGHRTASSWDPGNWESQCTPRPSLT